MTTSNLVKTSFIFVLYAFFSLSIQAQIKADFSSKNPNGCAPLLVNFTDNSTGNPSSWKWDLGNGTISYLQNPSVVYFNPGQYTVKLIVKNATGEDSVAKSQYITVYENPVIDFSASSTNGCPALLTNFSDLSTSVDGSIQSWKWDFGDGTLSQDKNPQHTYVNTGNFNVSLMVTNNHGCSNSNTKDKYIKVLEKPIVSFVNSSVTNCGTPQVIHFQNSSNGSGILKYKWDFGDGNISNEAKPSHTYTKSGSFTIKLFVTNDNGCTDSLIKRNAFTINNINTDFNIPEAICINSSFSINNLSSPAPTTTLWNFGDNTTSGEKTPVKTYTKAGSYKIKLINNFGGCTDSITKSIDVVERPLAEFTANSISSCQTPFDVQFNNKSLHSENFTWSFGDSTTSTITNPNKTFTKEGNFTITLTAFSAGGCSDTVTKSQYVNIKYPIATMNNFPKKGCAPL
ncbi:MAG: PKD domain-containing protein, partial [Ferruginibacter sp.]|nr:PKD domain-containing protein [Ferruginibacter sp.]